MANIFTNNITGIVLAGGKSSRMHGHNKGLALLNGKPLVAHVIQRLRPQVSDLLISANDNISEYEKFGLLVVQDTIAGHAGPLAGIAACMAQAETEYVLCVPCDSPYLPDDLSARLYHSMIDNQAELAYVHDGIRPQPLFALIQRGLMNSIFNYLASDHHKVDSWYHGHRFIECDYSDKQADFININSEKDLKKMAIQDKI